jgi:hypothetical protein
VASIAIFLAALSQTESILVVLICIATVGFYLVSQRYLKDKAAEANKVDEYKNAKAAWSRVSYPIAGTLLIAFSLFSLGRIPPENTPLVFVFIAFGVALILYGVFSWYKKTHGNRD